MYVNYQSNTNKLYENIQTCVNQYNKWHDLYLQKNATIPFIFEWDKEL